jgi:hypothetical protein
VALNTGTWLTIFRRSSSKTPNPEGFNPAYLSKTGAFNGSGIAIASSSFAQGGYGVINLYVQHWTGDIRKVGIIGPGIGVLLIGC